LKITASKKGEAEADQINIPEWHFDYEATEAGTGRKRICSS
jgi:hypothetical protein